MVYNLMSFAEVHLEGNSFIEGELKVPKWVAVEIARKHKRKHFGSQDRSNCSYVESEYTQTIFRPSLKLNAWATFISPAYRELELVVDLQWPANV
ncbi:unnamed protein product [Haemonchus placei]|uniref:DNA replication complex GINS protein PSF3 n=1 Tax=Haemonchus placei TaxID=6290 RepID=A0A0N4X7C7_HAEPC|nr:unnamed protein product [Haemonchus placei]